MRRIIGVQKWQHQQHPRNGSKLLLVRSFFQNLKNDRFFRNFNKLFLDDTTTVTGVMIQVSEVKKWIEHIEGKRDFPEENNLTHFYVTVSEKKKSLIGSAGWKKIGTFETNYKWDAEKGISYHKFDK